MLLHRWMCSTRGLGVVQYPLPRPQGQSTWELNSLEEEDYPRPKQPQRQNTNPDDPWHSRNSPQPYHCISVARPSRHPDGSARPPTALLGKGHSASHRGPRRKNGRVDRQLSSGARMSLSRCILLSSMGGRGSLNSSRKRRLWMSSFRLSRLARIHPVPPLRILSREPCRMRKTGRWSI